MKKYLLLLVIGGLFSACAPQALNVLTDDEPLSANYVIAADQTNGRDGYLINYPATWSLESAEDGSTLMLSPLLFDFQARPEPERNASLFVSISPKTPPSLADLAKNIQRVSQLQNPSATVTWETVTLNGFDAVRIEHQNVNVARGLIVLEAATEAIGAGSGYPGSAVEYAVDGPKSRYRVSYTVLGNDSKRKAVLEAIAQSFLILP
jgi:hypothetical protein